MASAAGEVWSEAAFLGALAATRALTTEEAALLAEFEGALLEWEIESRDDVPPKLRAVAARVERGERLGEADRRAVACVAAWLDAAQ
jgi:hypothetical protein